MCLEMYAQQIMQLHAQPNLNCIHTKCLNVYPYMQAQTCRKIGIFDDHDWCSMSAFIFGGYVNPASIFNMMQCCNLPGLREWEAGSHLKTNQIHSEGRSWQTSWICIGFHSYVQYSENMRNKFADKQVNIYWRFKLQTCCLITWRCPSKSCCPTRGSSIWGFLCIFFDVIRGRVESLK